MLQLLADEQAEQLSTSHSHADLQFNLHYVAGLSLLYSLRKAAVCTAGSPQITAHRSQMPSRSTWRAHPSYSLVDCPLCSKRKE
jgi:hypothetical protein